MVESVKCFATITVILTLWSTLIITVRSWKMDLCLLGTAVTVYEETCPYGIWFSQPWEISSACVDGGIWAIYKSWCEEPAIWTAHPSKNGGCIRHSILTQVSGIVYLGAQDTGAVVSTKHHRLVLASDYFERKIASQSNIGSKNSRKNAILPSSLHWTIEKTEEELDILAWGPTLFMSHATSPAGSAEKCLLKGRHAYSASYEFPLIRHDNLTFKLDRTDTCISRRRWEYNSQLLPLRLDSLTIVSSAKESSASNQEFHCILKNATFDRKIRSRTFKRNIENMNFMTHSRDVDLMTVNDVEKINEQTERLARKLIAHVFMEEPLPEMGFMDWKFLMMAQEIFEASCPFVLVPKGFFKNILIFFRFILAESFDKFPPKMEHIAQETQYRIEKNLKQCLGEAEPLPFKELENKICVDAAEPLIIEFDHDNGTMEDIHVDIPMKVKMDPKTFDVILESVWKLQLFVHYHCTHHFEQFPTDLSDLYHRWQELFAPDILTRWQCPGKTYEMVRTIIRNVNLAKVVKYLDLCVAAAHMNSPYTMWLSRPKPLKYNPENLATNSGGQQFQDFDQVTAEKTASGKKKSGRRIGLTFDASKDGFDFYASPMGADIPEPEWDQVTYCMSSYDHPAKVLGLSYDRCGAYPTPAAV